MFCPLTNLTIPGSVTNIGDSAFCYCTALTAVYFQGNAPNLGYEIIEPQGWVDYTAFSADPVVTAYYVPGTTGWAEFATETGVPIVPWLAEPADTEQRTRFWGAKQPVWFHRLVGHQRRVGGGGMHESGQARWQPVGTKALTSGTFYFSDPGWTNYPGRFYRLRAE